MTLLQSRPVTAPKATIQTLRNQRARVWRQIAQVRGQQAVALLYSDAAAIAELEKTVTRLEGDIDRLTRELRTAAKPLRGSAATTRVRPSKLQAPTPRVQPSPSRQSATRVSQPRSAGSRAPITSTVEAERVIAAVWLCLDERRQAQITLERMGSISAVLKIATDLRDEFAPVASR